MHDLLKSFIVFIFVFFFCFPEVNKVFAITDPSSVTNNKYGIHITDESDIKNAANLVNSSGGDWGYVTFVIREDERDTNRWQNFFNELRKEHLIPIVRIASKQGDGYWTKLNIDEIDGWVGFLNSLNWVTQNRYVVVGNEVNLGIEWGGKADPKEYADYLNIFSKKLKSSSNDYFIMASALDSQAKNTKSDIDEDKYLTMMIQHKADLYDSIDGLASHSYPYKSVAKGSDAQTVKNFEWELNLLNFLGIKKELPVFITETGWKNGNGLTEEAEISDSMKDTNSEVWNNSKIVAITPFVLNYTSKPFVDYSWTAPNGRHFLFYDVYKKFSKLKGTPLQVVSAEVVSYILPRFLKTKFNNTYGLMYIKNTGQTIWRGYQPVALIINGKRTIIKPITILSDVYPQDKALVVYTVK